MTSRLAYHAVTTEEARKLEAMGWEINWHANLHNHHGFYGLHSAMSPEIVEDDWFVTVDTMGAR